MSDFLDQTYAARVLITFPDTGIAIQRVARGPASSADEAKRRMIEGLSIIGQVTILSEPVIDNSQRLLSLRGEQDDRPARVRL